VVWLAAAAVAATGDGVLYFGLGWVASGYGARAAGWVLALVLVPRTVLLLVGGALGDRWGLRATLLRTQAATVLLLLGAAALDVLAGRTLGGLALLAFGVGLVSAFALPASGAFPRLFAADDVLPRLMSTVGVVLQTSRLLGPPLGGLLLGVAGLVGGLAAAAVSAAALLVVLVLVRPPRADPVARDAAGLLTGIGSGLAAARVVPGLPALLAAVALVAGTLISLLSLGVPLLGRAHGWGAVGTGTIESAWVVGSLAVSLLVAARGALRRAVVALVAGPVLAGAGVVVVALAADLRLASVGSVVMGAGTATFTTHVFPLVVRQTPDGMLARFQAVLGVGQAAAVLLSTVALGALAGGVGVVPATLAAGAVSALAGVVVLLSAPLRAARL
jgi:MFS family permease